MGVPDDVVEIRIEISDEEDPARDERAARGLRDELLALDDVVKAGFPSLDSIPPAGAKGPVATDTIVLVSTVASSAAGVVIAFIRARADRSSHRKVVASSDGSVEVHGGIGDREERLVRDLLGVESDADSGRKNVRSRGAGDNLGG
jgi:hypothetical protein